MKRATSPTTKSAKPKGRKSPIEPSTAEGLVERARTEEALHESEERFRRVFSNNMVPMGVWTKIGGIINANDALLDMLGFTRKELEEGSINWVERTPPEYHEQDLKAVAEVESKGFCAPYEKVFLCKDGHPVPIVIGGGSFDERAGAGIFFAVDITERKRAEQALRASEERFRALATTSSEVVYRMSPDWRVMSHLDGKDFIADTHSPNSTWFDQYVFAEDQPQVSAAIQQAIQSKSPFDLEHRVRRADGSAGWTHSRAVPILNASGEITEWFGSASDITERKRVQETLRDKEQEMQRARDYAEGTLRTSPVPLLVLESDLRVKTANEAFFQTFQVEASETDGRLVYGLGNGQWNISKLRQLLEDILPNQTLFTGFEVTHEFETIGRRAMLLNARRMENELGAPERIVLVIEDITERKRAEILADSQRQALQLLAEGAELDEVLKFLVGVVQRYSANGMVAAITLLNDAGTHFQRGIGDSLPESLNQSFEGVPVSSPTGLCAVAIRRREAVAVPDFMADPAWRPFGEFIAPYGLRSGWSIPIFSSTGRVLGTFANYYRNAVDPTPPDPEMVDMVVRTAAIAIQRKHAERQMQDSEERFRMLADNMSQLAWTCDRLGNVDWYNQRWLDYTGLAFEDMEGWNWSKVQHPDHLDRVVAHVKHSAETGEPWEDTFPLRSKSGEYRWFLSRAIPIKDESGNIVRWFGTNTDVEEQRRAVAEITRLAALADFAPDFVALANLDEKVIYVNESGRKLLGITSDFQVRTALLDFVHESDRVRFQHDVLQGALAAGESWSGETVFRHFQTDEPIMTEQRAFAIRESTGAIIQYGTVAHDVRSAKQAEEALRRSEKLGAVGRMAATMAHEVNNPLESVTNLLYLAKKDKNMSEQTRQQLVLAGQELRRVAHITNQALGFYRDSAGPASLDVSQTIRDLLEVYNYRFRNREISLEKELDVSATVVTSSGELRQVFSNLLINAVDATPTGGRIKVRVRPSRYWNGSRRLGVRITVADTGCGIDPAHRPKIFDAFFTTKQEVGTGLGLWLSRSIVQKRGGHIQVHSRVDPGKSGTVFSVFWPDDADVNISAAEEIA